MMKIHNLTNPDRVNGTSFFGATILASCNEICSKLGIDVTCYGGDKTNFDFELELEDGTPFTIYDWKEGDWVDEDTLLYYHIGARNSTESKKVVLALNERGLNAKEGRMSSANFFEMLDALVH